jgi:hypothetical protein
VVSEPLALPIDVSGIGIWISTWHDAEEESTLNDTWLEE